MSNEPNVQDTSMSETSRRWDGKPETDSDRRFFDLRASGYTGPIDQDGYAVDESEFRDAMRVRPVGDNEEG